MSGQDREGETWEAQREGMEDCVTVFLVVRSRPGNWRDRPAWVHTVLALDVKGVCAVPVGGTWEFVEDESCETFLYYFKRIGSLLPETG